MGNPSPNVPLVSGGRTWRLAVLPRRTPGNTVLDDFVVWLTDPRDQFDHAWYTIDDTGRWKALCGLVSGEAILDVPEDEYGRHDLCLVRWAIRRGESLPMDDIQVDWSFEP